MKYFDEIIDGKKVLKDLRALAERRSRGSQSLRQISVLNAGDGAAHESRNRLIAEYHATGAAIFSISDTEASAATVRAVAAQLHLGTPFLPPLYADAFAAGEISPISVLSATRGAGINKRHPSFNSASQQELHSDGTLQDIGTVKTTMMLCASPGAAGGESEIFPSTTVFLDLLCEDEPAALALMAPCLRRTATFGNAGESNLGPAFAIVNGELLSRFSITSTDAFESTDSHQDELARAVDFFKRRIKSGKDTLTIGLRRNQGLLLANDKVSHGRRAYSDSPEQSRVMLRGLYLTRPYAAAETISHLSEFRNGDLTNAAHQSATTAAL